jgi:flagellar biosynthesis protein FliR
VDLVIDTSWTAGYLAAMVRIGAFVVATPLLSRRLPFAGRMAFVLSLSLFLAEPPGRELDLPALFEIVASNLAVGLLLGFLTTVLFNAFFIAGGLVDVVSGLAIGAQFDPLTGVQASVFDRFFDLTAAVLFFVIGGDRVLISGLDASVRAVPLGGSVEISPGLADLLAERITLLVLAALEVAAPALAALFLTELVLALASRLMPQANIFLVGLPLKQLLAVGLAAIVVASLPTSVHWFVGEMESTFLDGLAGMRPG